MKKRNILTSVLAATLLAASLVTTALAAGSYTDVPTEHWAYASIQRASALGIVNGVGNDEYAPENTVTNAQFATMMTRAFYPGVVEGYINYYGTAGEWWAPYIESAYAKSLLNGTSVLTPRESGDFAWDGTVSAAINRYDMAQFMYNYIVKEGVLPSDAEIGDAKAGISDWDDIPERYQEAVAACFAAGLISGVGDGVFSGESSMSRAQAATVLCRLVDYTAVA